MSNTMEQTREMVDEVCEKENAISERPKELSESQFEVDESGKEPIHESRR